MRSKRYVCLILPIITLALEILPFGAVCNFANPEGEPFRETYSYFSLTPFGYANFSPLITAVLTCVVIILLAVFCITGKERFATAAKSVLCICTVCSFGPLAFGIRYYSAVGFIISLTLILQLAVPFYTNRMDKEKSE